MASPPTRKNRTSSRNALLRVLPLAGVLALAAACDRRDTEDDTTRTAADTEIDRAAGAEAPPAPGPEASPGTDAEVAATVSPEPPDAGETGAPGTPAAALSQADALALLVAINEHEIAAADQALRKNVTGAVRQFADMMRVDHTRNLTDTTKLGGAASTHPTVTGQKRKGEAELRTLDAQTGNAYEKAYMDAMVKGHEEALGAIDNAMLPAATDDRVRQHFTATRTAVANHLERARQVRSGLQ